MTASSSTLPSRTSAPAARARRTGAASASDQSCRRRLRSRLIVAPARERRIAALGRLARVRRERRGDPAEVEPSNPRTGRRRPRARHRRVHARAGRTRAARTRPGPDRGPGVRETSARSWHRGRRTARSCPRLRREAAARWRPRTRRLRRARCRRPRDPSRARPTATFASAPATNRSNERRLGERARRGGHERDEALTEGDDVGHGRRSARAVATAATTRAARSRTPSGSPSPSSQPPIPTADGTGRDVGRDRLEGHATGRQERDVGEWPAELSHERGSHRRGREQLDGRRFGTPRREHLGRGRAPGKAGMPQGRPADEVRVEVRHDEKVAPASMARRAASMRQDGAGSDLDAEVGTDPGCCLERPVGIGDGLVEGQFEGAHTTDRQRLGDLADVADRDPASDGHHAARQDARRDRRSRRLRRQGVDLLALPTIEPGQRTARARPHAASGPSPGRPRRCSRWRSRSTGTR